MGFFVVICFNSQQNYGRHHLDRTKLIASMFPWVCCLVPWLIAHLYLGSVLLLKVGCYEGLTTIKQEKIWGRSSQLLTDGTDERESGQTDTSERSGGWGVKRCSILGSWWVIALAGLLRLHFLQADWEAAAVIYFTLGLEALCGCHSKAAWLSVCTVLTSTAISLHHPGVLERERTLIQT